MMLLLPKWLAGFSGVFVDAFGYQMFFISTAIIGLPVLILIWLTMYLNIGQNKKIIA
jgi:PAT family beta-lactamase induction signal transducer AmpG